MGKAILLMTIRGLLVVRLLRAVAIDFLMEPLTGMRVDLILLAWMVVRVVVIDLDGIVLVLGGIFSVSSVVLVKALCGLRQARCSMIGFVGWCRLFVFFWVIIVFWLYYRLGCGHRRAICRVCGLLLG